MRRHSLADKITDPARHIPTRTGAPRQAGMPDSRLIKSGGARDYVLYSQALIARTLGGWHEICYQPWQVSRRGCLAGPCQGHTATATPATFIRPQQSAMRNTKGFTLIELMIVIAILAILLAIAIPAYQDLTVRAKLMEGISMATSPKAGVVEHYHSSGGGLPGSNSEAGLPPPSSYQTDFVESIEIGTPADGDITITMDNSATGIPELGSNNILSLTPVTNQGAVDWRCGVGHGSTNIEPKYLPSSCR